ncbi:(deoxy)nucleoside triphosphate pyrophosphohydrolase [Paenibacillus sp. OV219]|uniref:(deoxy)nucleoside triphosphate pyrophosphohydrolase n=1 Tax=Paenibacillus sp. OV219 TaxID=1884377 RepID=UPI0008CB6FA6|nr:(deoxy)nucleoside triphosphate pyrophosphohydrolase [Paenibacillus sp. OV219]SEP01088.1 8-oxo-dGTP diphosphatase [Paenibacillus sp. OV219]
MILVAAAIIEDKQGKILIARRKEGKSQGRMWEFPGGKIEANETAEECLRRELREEMNIEIDPYEFFGENDHFYGELHIKLIAYKAQFLGGEIKLVDHDDYKWVSHGQLFEYEFAPADVKFVEMLGLSVR